MEELRAIYERMREVFAKEAGFVPNDGCDMMVRLYALAAEVQSYAPDADLWQGSGWGETQLAEQIRAAREAGVVSILAVEEK